MAHRVKRNGVVAVPAASVVLRCAWVAALPATWCLGSRLRSAGVAAAPFLARPQPHRVGSRERQVRALPVIRVQRVQAAVSGREAAVGIGWRAGGVWRAGASGSGQQRAGGGWRARARRGKRRLLGNGHWQAGISIAGRSGHRQTGVKKGGQR